MKKILQLIRTTLLRLSLKKRLVFIGISCCMFLIIVINSFTYLYSLSYNRVVGYDPEAGEILEFPEGFLWGSATAAYQVEGGNFNSNWWRFEQTEGNIDNNDSAEIATDHYNRYSEDIDLMGEMNLNTYRFSIEWSRIQPQKHVYDDTEIEHYRAVLQELREKEIIPMVTIWHTSVPAWFEDEGGWTVRSNIDYYVEYVKYVADQLSDEVSLWLTMNEPMAYITTGYVSAKWPPAEQRFDKVPVLFKNLTEGHNRAYDAIHSVDADAQVGMSEHSSYISPNHKNNAFENILAFVIDYSWTHMFLDKIKNNLDFVGVHYYYKQTIDVGLVKELITSNSISSFESESTDRAYYPEGLFEVLMRFRQYDIPIYITELGVHDWHEVDREVFVRDHVREIYYAIREGVDVRGIYYWSLLDNFEWSGGYDYKFGLVAVDRETQGRTIKDSAWEYALIAGCNCVGNTSNP